jgi:hypothetical protein
MSDTRIAVIETDNSEGIELETSHADGGKLTVAGDDRKRGCQADRLSAETETKASTVRDNKGNA